MTASQTLLDALARQVAAVTGWAYGPDSPFPSGSVPVALAGYPNADPLGNGQAVALTTYAGPEPNSGGGVEYPRLQVRVRGKDMRDALALARKAYDGLQTLRVALPAPSGASQWFLTDCYALQSDPAPMGRDESGRWEFSTNYQLNIERTT